METSDALVISFVGFTKKRYCNYDRKYGSYDSQNEWTWQPVMNPPLIPRRRNWDHDDGCNQAYNQRPNIGKESPRATRHPISGMLAPITCNQMWHLSQMGINMDGEKWQPQCNTRGMNREKQAHMGRSNHCESKSTNKDQNGN